MKPLNLQIEKNFWEKEFLVIGVDEVGRGALAGPLTVAAVCFPLKIEKNNDDERFLINDSKKISFQKRKRLAWWIKKHCLAFAISNISHQVIDKKGIVFAFEKGVRKVIKKISQKINHQRLVVLIDGFLVKRLSLDFKNKPIIQQALINGDGRCFSIASSSIIAKVYRDQLMSRLSKKYPQYHFEENKGYGTKEHFKALKRYGLSLIHRRSYLKAQKGSFWDSV